MRVKEGIFALYRSEWLDVANFVFISACIQCGHSAEDGVKMFQSFLNVGEDELDTDSLKTSYYRSLRKFRHCMPTERKLMQAIEEPGLSPKDMEKLRTMMQEVMSTMNKKKERRKPVFENQPCLWCVNESENRT